MIKLTKQTMLPNCDRSRLKPTAELVRVVRETMPPEEIVVWQVKVRR